MNLSLVIALIALVWIGVVTAIIQKRHKSTRAHLRRLGLRVGMLENLLRTTYARTFEAEPDRTGVTPGFPVRFQSQHGEDLFIWEIFRGKPDGFFVEAGAFDGYTASNTYALEALGWTGLLVEPIEDRAEEARRRRPGSRVLRSALGIRGCCGTAEFSVNPSERLAGQLISRLSAPAAIGGGAAFDWFETAQVPITSLEEALAFHEGPIDVAFIDVEGHELEVLDGLNLERRRPRVFVLEDHSLENDSKLGQYLHDRGYLTTGWISYNRVMVEESETLLLQRSRELLTFSDSALWPRGVPDTELESLRPAIGR